MTAMAMTQKIGSQVLVRMEAFSVLCDVLDAKNAYGNVRYLVRPVAGDGEAWVDAGRCAEPRTVR
jgi:hypothetical protein